MHTSPSSYLKSGNSDEDFHEASQKLAKILRRLPNRFPSSMPSLLGLPQLRPASDPVAVFLERAFKVLGYLGFLIERFVPGLLQSYGSIWVQIGLSSVRIASSAGGRSRWFRLGARYAKSC